jgi:hypothetical protein
MSQLVTNIKKWQTVSNFHEKLFKDKTMILEWLIDAKHKREWNHDLSIPIYF